MISLQTHGGSSNGRRLQQPQCSDTQQRVTRLCKTTTTSTTTTSLKVGGSTQIWRLALKKKQCTQADCGKIKSLQGSKLRGQGVRWAHPTSVHISTTPDNNMPIEAGEQAWALKQCEKYTTWLNTLLRTSNGKKPKLIQDLRKSIGDGHTLVLLVEQLTGNKIQGAINRAITRYQKINNTKCCLKSLESRGFNTDDIVASELVDGNLKLVILLLERIRKGFDTSLDDGGFEQSSSSQSTLRSIKNISTSPQHDYKSLNCSSADNSSGYVSGETRRTNRGAFTLGNFECYHRNIPSINESCAGPTTNHLSAYLPSRISLPGSCNSPIPSPVTVMARTKPDVRSLTQHDRSTARPIIPSVRKNSLVNSSETTTTSSSVEQKLKLLLEGQDSLSVNNEDEPPPPVESTDPPPGSLSRRPSTSSSAHIQDVYTNNCAEADISLRYFGGPKQEKSYRERDSYIAEWSTVADNKPGMNNAHPLKMPSADNVRDTVYYQKENIKQSRPVGQQPHQMPQKQRSYTPSQSPNMFVSSSAQIRTLNRTYSPQRTPSITEPVSHITPHHDRFNNPQRSNYPQQRPPSSVPRVVESGPPPQSHYVTMNNSIDGPQYVPQKDTDPSLKMGAKRPDSRLSSPQKDIQYDQYPTKQKSILQNHAGGSQRFVERTPSPAAAVLRPPSRTNQMSSPQNRSQYITYVDHSTPKSGGYSKTPPTTTIQPPHKPAGGIAPPPNAATGSAPQNKFSFLSNLSSTIRSSMPRNTSMASEKGYEAGLDDHSSDTGSTYSDSSSDSAGTPQLPALSPNDSPPETPVPGVHLGPQIARSSSATVIPSFAIHTEDKKGRKTPPKKNSSVKRSTSIQHVKVNVPKTGKARRDKVLDELQGVIDGSKVGKNGKGEIESLKKQVDSLQTLYKDLMRLIGDKSESEGEESSASRQSSNSKWSFSKYYSPKTRRSKKRARDLRIVNRRFQRLESHVVTLARSVAQLSSEMRSRQAMMNEITTLRDEIEEYRNNIGLRADADPFLSGYWGFQKSRESAINSPIALRVKKLKRFFGDDPPLLSMFLKNLGYEKYIKNFEAEKIGMLELPYLNEERMAHIGIPLGPRLRIVQEARVRLFSCGELLGMV